MKWTLTFMRGDRRCVSLLVCEGKMLKANCDINWGMILIECKPLQIKAHFTIGDRSQQTHFCIGVRVRPSTLDIRRSLRCE